MSEQNKKKRGSVARVVDQVEKAVSQAPVDVPVRSYVDRKDLRVLVDHVKNNISIDTKMLQDQVDQALALALEQLKMLVDEAEKESDRISAANSIIAAANHLVRRHIAMNSGTGDVHVHISKDLEIAPVEVQKLSDRDA